MPQPKLHRGSQTLEDRGLLTFTPFRGLQGVPVPPDCREIMDGDPSPGEAELDRIQGKKSRGFFDTHKTFFFAHCHNLAVLQEDSCRMVTDVHRLEGTIVHTEDVRICAHSLLPCMFLQLLFTRATISSKPKTELHMFAVRYVLKPKLLTPAFNLRQGMQIAKLWAVHIHIPEIDLIVRL